MFSLRLIGLLCFLASANCSVYEVEDSVLLLNDSNFEQAIEDHKLLFVMFYLPFVDDCQAMAPEFAKAAKQLEDAGSGIKLAKVYASFEGHLSWEYVRGIPTLMFYREGQLVRYSGNRTAEAMVQWVRKKAGNLAQPLFTADDARAFVDSAQVAVVGFFKNQTSVEAKEFLKAAYVLDHHVFAITSNDVVYRELGATKDGVMLFKKFDDRNTTLDMPVTSENVQKFVQQNSLPLVVDFTNQNAPDVFSWPTRQYLTGALVFFLYSLKTGK
uniref:protein disulfide-isomerase n=1 Tax=Rhipicephalus microplus TaxID=6941 RepID=A0A6M2D5V7_RHIMP